MFYSSQLLLKSVRGLREPKMFPIKSANASVSLIGVGAIGVNNYPPSSRLGEVAGEGLIIAAGARLADIAAAVEGLGDIVLDYDTAIEAATSYANSLGSGDRVGSIGISYSGSIDGAVTLTIDGVISGGSRMVGTSANHNWQFDFGTSRLITRLRHYQGGVGNLNCGNWKVQGSHDASAWDDLTGIFAWDTSATAERDFSSNETAYRYYRLLKTSGSIGGGARIGEFEFEIDAG